MAWRAEDLATLAKGEGCKLALDGAALVANRSGVTFDSAKLTLIAGEPNRMQRGTRPPTERYMAADAAAAAPGTLPSERTAGEYHAYEIPTPARLTQGATERLALFAQHPARLRARMWSRPEARMAPPRPRCSPTSVARWACCR
jgi:hypothetical protein